MRVRSHLTYIYEIICMCLVLGGTVLLYIYIKSYICATIYYYKHILLYIYEIIYMCFGLGGTERAHARAAHVAYIAVV